MKHFLITRFNVRVEGWETSRDGEKVLTPEWLEERFRLFETYCLPSVINQTNQNFDWCIFFDINTPQQFKQKVTKLSQTYPNIVAIYIKDMSSLIPKFRQYILSKADKEEFIITSRLDNDDLIHKNFIQTIRDNFVEKANVVIDLRRGYQVTLGDDFQEIRAFDFNFNPFVSYIEKAKASLKTVMHKNHRDFKYTKLQTIVKQPPLWIELVHSSNKYNSVRKEYKRILDFDNAAFGLSGKLVFKERSLAVFVHNNIINLKSKLKKIKRKLNV
ncbi:glycosyltransferase [Haloflavibacter putidus]|uniref:Rhamnosyl transferase n=1 Tax=Haloflavibacter putidus TaxID=2576776 RepID=A0A507Z8H8_9FLAO|nr:glycosyltransferase [Haloflavibacter putidus]TQD33810.1 hypothetical protein FKR84_12690 [Haloflavibacter putidus]